MAKQISLPWNLHTNLALCRSDRRTVTSGSLLASSIPSTNMSCSDFSISWKLSKVCSTTALSTSALHFFWQPQLNAPASHEADSLVVADTAAEAVSSWKNPAAVEATSSSSPSDAMSPSSSLSNSCSYHEIVISAPTSDPKYSFSISRRAPHSSLSTVKWWRGVAMLCLKQETSHDKILKTTTFS